MMSSFFGKKYGKEVGDKIFLRNSKMLFENLIATCDGKCNLIRDFSFEELQTATNNFDIGKVIGNSSLHTLYKGVLGDRPITVMKYEKMQIYFEESVNNIVYASQMSHKNVLKLIGCCLKTEIPILVFESVEYGTLQDHICGPHDQCHFEPLVWRDRLRIAMGIANALAYLHVGFPRPIVHRDVNLCSILLDEQYVAKLSDFSYCHIIPEGETHIKDDDACSLKGTAYFSAPEYIQTRIYNEKCDVFSFGGLLLVLLTGKPVHWRSPKVEGNIYLQVYVEKCYQGNKLNGIADPIIVGDETLPGKDQQLQDFAELALKCCSYSAKDRPTMVDVAKRLRQMYKSSIDTP